MSPLKHSIKISVSPREWINSTHLSPDWHLLRCALRIIIIKSLNSRVKEIAHLLQITRLLMTNCKLLTIHKQYKLVFSSDKTFDLMIWAQASGQGSDNDIHPKYSCRKVLWTRRNQFVFVFNTNQYSFHSIDMKVLSLCTRKMFNEKRRKSEFGASLHKN